MSDIEFRILELKEQVTHLEVARNDLQMQMQAQLQVKQQAVEKRRSQARLLRRKEQLDLAITLLNERKEASRADCERLRASNDERRRALAHAKTRLALARREQIEDTSSLLAVEQARGGGACRVGTLAVTQCGTSPKPSRPGAGAARAAL